MIDKHCQIGDNNIMKDINKYNYINVLQGQYGQGWEDLCADESYKEIRQNLKEYRENEGGSYRIIQRRECNPEYNRVSTEIVQ